MSLLATTVFSLPRSGPPDAFDLILNVEFADKRDFNAAQFNNVGHRLPDVLSTIGWRLVEIAPMDDAVNGRHVPAIAKFYYHQRPAIGIVLMGKI